MNASRVVYGNHERRGQRVAAILLSVTALSLSLLWYRDVLSAGWSLYQGPHWSVWVVQGAVEAWWHEDYTAHSYCCRVPMIAPCTAAEVESLLRYFQAGPPYWRYVTWLPRLAKDGGTLPLWIPAVLVLGCSGLVALHSRPSPPGHCPCGYDLTGNVSGRCPECGRPVSGPVPGAKRSLAES